MSDKIEIRRIYDKELIKSIVTDVDIFDKIRDDFTPSAEDFQPIVHESFYYLGVFINQICQGLVFFHPILSLVYEAHPCFKRKMWGKISVVSAKKTIEWMFSNTSCLNIIGFVPNDNPLVDKLCSNIGMTKIGKLQNCFLYNKNLKGLSIYSIGKVV